MFIKILKVKNAAESYAWSEADVTLRNVSGFTEGSNARYAGGSFKIGLRMFMKLEYLIYEIRKNFLTLRII